MAKIKVVEFRYFGSQTGAHGTVIDIDECVCPSCVLLDPWDVARRFSLCVVPDADPTRHVHLIHVRHESFTGWR